ncbi:putative F-box protein [Cardamine amara subsp. amara]|uniref:F-box protein n=1 Tax=Cardamine amara subsp. amara TaxID=228776 RepID=A0ABD1BI63_CARAN
MRFKCVSKVWSSLISSRYFNNLFFKVPSSPKRERRVFLSVVGLIFYSEYLLCSGSSSFLEIKQDLTYPGKGGLMVNALRGLMCFRIGMMLSASCLGRELRIYNLTTRQVVNFPKVESNMLNSDSCMWNNLGHDPVNDEYKVLSIVWSEWGRLETKVLVLGAGASWRNTRRRKSHTPHPFRPPYSYTQVISINGVLYYGARCDKKRCVVMSFDWACEEFNMIESPVKARITWLS